MTLPTFTVRWFVGNAALVRELEHGPLLEALELADDYEVGRLDCRAM
jgi:hypothetical protein